MRGWQDWLTQRATPRQVRAGAGSTCGPIRDITIGWKSVRARRPKKPAVVCLIIAAPSAGNRCWTEVAELKQASFFPLGDMAVVHFLVDRLDRQRRLAREQQA